MTGDSSENVVDALFLDSIVGTRSRSELVVMEVGAVGVVGPFYRKLLQWDSSLAVLGKLSCNPPPVRFLIMDYEWWL